MVWARRVRMDNSCGMAVRAWFIAARCAGVRPVADSGPSLAWGVRHARAACTPTDTCLVLLLLEERKAGVNGVLAAPGPAHGVWPTHVLCAWTGPAPRGSVGWRVLWVGAARKHSRDLAASPVATRRFSLGLHVTSPLLPRLEAAVALAAAPGLCSGLRLGRRGRRRLDLSGLRWQVKLSRGLVTGLALPVARQQILNSLAHRADNAHAGAVRRGARRAPPGVPPQPAAGAAGMPLSDRVLCCLHRAGCGLGVPAGAPRQML